ncbi:WAT1-related protein, partial [Mucuna pruriens]
MQLMYRLECVKVKEVRSQAKVIGTLVSFGGALLMAIYKGPGFNLFHSGGATHQENGSSSSHNHQTAGAIYILMGCVALSCFYILQSITVKRYPVELSLATLICLAGTVETTAVALVAERHSRAWALGWDYRLYAPFYTGVVSSGIAYYVQGLVMKLRGPVFATAFNPLCMIIVACLGSLVLGELLRLGSIIGGIIIAVGLYLVVWGKAKDHYSDPKLPSAHAQDTKSLPITATDDSKINIISGNLEKQPSTQAEI